MDTMHMISFIDKVDEIYRQFIESLVTRQRDPVFGPSKDMHAPDDQSQPNPKSWPTDSTEVPTC